MFKQKFVLQALYDKKKNIFYYLWDIGYSRAPNENIVQNHLNIAFLNVF